MKIHAHHEDFEPHFVGITDPEQRLERISENVLQENGLRTEDVGKIKASFANLLALPTHSFLTRQQALFYKSTSGNVCFSSFLKRVAASNVWGGVANPALHVDCLRALS